MARKEFLASSRKLRRKRLILRAVVFGVVFLAVFVGVVAFFRISYFQVDKIEISGNGSLVEKELAEAIKSKLEGKYLWLFPKANIFLIPKAKILTELPVEFKRIKKIILDKKYFDTIVIKLEERGNAVIFCKKEDCAYADENGFVFEKAPYFSGAVFLKLVDQRNSDNDENEKTIEKHIGASLMAESEFKKILEFIDFTEKTGGGVSEVILKKENIYEFYTQEGWKIILNDKNIPKDAYLNIVTALDSTIKDNRTKLDYIDLRLGNKVFFKYRY